MSTMIKFTPTVGVAPGTTTMQLGSTVLYPYGGSSIVDMRGLGVVDTRARIRWDLILGIGGLATVVAATAGLIANAIGNIRK